MNKKTLIQIFKVSFFLGIGIFSIWWFLQLLSPEEKKEIWAAFSRANYWWLILSMFVGIIAHYIRALRWNILIEPLGYKQNNIDTFCAVAIGYIGNLILPRFGEFARSYTLKKTSKAPFTSLLGTVIVERIFDMIVFLIFFIIGVYFFFKQLQSEASGFLFEFLEGITIEKIFILVGISLIFLSGLIALYFLRKKINHIAIFNKSFQLINKFRDGLTSLVKIKKWPLFIIYTIIIWLCYVVMTWLCFFALEETTHLSFNAAFASVAFGTIGIILVQGGIGVYPALVSQTLVLFGITNSIGYAMGWLTWLSQTIIIILIGLWAIAYLMFKKGLNLNDFRKNSTENN